MTGDSIENPIEIPDDVITKEDQGSARAAYVPDTTLARSIYDQFYSPTSTFKSTHTHTHTRAERSDRFNRYNRGVLLPQPTKVFPPVYEPKVEDGDEKTNVVEDSLDAMVKEMKELLLDHRKPSTPVQPRTPERLSPTPYKHSIYPYPTFDELYKKTAIPPKGPVKLDDLQLKFVNGVLNGGHIGTLSIKTAIVEFKDISKLRPDTWLNDEIINYYMELISDRSQKNKDKYPSIHCFNTFFCTTLLESGYAKLRRWTKRVDIFAKDMVLIPVNSSLHWTLAVFDFRKKQLAMYDSLGGNNMRLVKALLQYLEDEHMDKKKIAYDSSDWSVYIPKDIPHQRNGDDCGVFACTFAERIARDSEFDFTQKDMMDLRKNMVYEIIQKQLLVS
ncbi:Sentrin-specific protease 2 [Umbelopsis nana]